MPIVMWTVFNNLQISWYEVLEFMVLVLWVHGISSISLSGELICHCGHDGAVCDVAVFTGDGCWVSELADGGNGLFIIGCHWWYWWRWFFSGRLQCWSHEPPVPGVSGSRAHLNLIGIMGFLCGCPHWILLSTRLIAQDLIGIGWLSHENLNKTMCVPQVILTCRMPMLKV